MIRLYTEEDLGSFGKFLLSKERTERITGNHTPEDNIPLEERLSEVYHADLENWKSQHITAEVYTKLESQSYFEQLANYIKDQETSTG